MKAVAALPAVVLLAAASNSYGFVQSFSNAAGTFVFSREMASPPIAGRPLDVTQDASQGTTPSARSIWAEGFFHAGSTTVVPDAALNGQSSANPGGQARVARSTTPSIYMDQTGLPQQILALARFSSGDSIGPAQDWQVSSIYQVSSLSGPGLLFSGRTFVGVQFPMDDGTHYGFVEMTLPAHQDPTVFSWGYETQPNTPVVVPSPAGLMIMGAGLLVRRRR